MWVHCAITALNLVVQQAPDSLTQVALSTGNSHICQNLRFDSNYYNYTSVSMYVCTAAVVLHSCSYMRLARRRPRGFGFIEFRDARDAETAMRKLDGTTVGGREISVSAALLRPSYWGLKAMSSLPEFWILLISYHTRLFCVQVVMSKEARKTPREMLVRDPVRTTKPST